MTRPRDVKGEDSQYETPVSNIPAEFQNTLIATIGRPANFIFQDLTAKKSSYPESLSPILKLCYLQQKMLDKQGGINLEIKKISFI